MNCLNRTKKNISIESIDGFIRSLESSAHTGGNLFWKIEISKRWVPFVSALRILEAKTEWQWGWLKKILDNLYRGNIVEWIVIHFIENELWKWERESKKEIKKKSMNTYFLLIWIQKWYNYEYYLSQNNGRIFIKFKNNNWNELKKN